LGKETSLDFGLGLEWLVAAVPEALLIVGPGGRIEHANLSAAHMFGYALDDLVGAGIESLIPHRFRAKHVHARTDFEQSPHDRPMGGTLETTALRRDGSEIPVDIELRPRRTPEGGMTIAVVRERGVAARPASSTERTAAEHSEMWQIVAQHRPQLAEVVTRLADVLADVDTWHQEGRLVDGAFVETRRLAATARSNLVDLLYFIDEAMNRLERDR